MPLLGEIKELFGGFTAAADLKLNYILCGLQDQCYQIFKQEN